MREQYFTFYYRNLEVIPLAILGLVMTFMKYDFQKTLALTRKEKMKKPLVFLLFFIGYYDMSLFGIYLLLFIKFS
jgi:hypothetical protein